MTDTKNNKTVLPLTKKIKLPSSSESDHSEKLKNAAAASQDLGTAGSGSHVLSSPNSSRSPEDIVFSIDHILESILGNCDRQTLLNSRLVSRRWAFYGSKELQKTVSIIFHKSLFVPGGPRPRTFQFSTNTKRSLKDLITVMNNSPEFPCTSFDFRDKPDRRYRQSSAHPFFDAHGTVIRKIKFEYLWIDDLKNFLFSQAPNLEQLHLSRIVEAKYAHSTKRRSYSETQKQRSERERRQGSLFDEATSIPKPILKNLRTFRCRLSAQVPAILIQQILECSPNLVDVALPSEHLHLLVQPTNRVHLVKKLTIQMYSSNIESHELFANHLQDNEDFAVRKLYYRNGENFGDDGEERVTNVMRQILRASSATCQKLVWGDKVGNLQIPRMPRLKHLAINYYFEDGTHEDEGEDSKVLVNSLGDGVSLGDTFPSLKAFELRSSSVIRIHPILNIFSDVDPLPAANVKTVTMRLRHPRRKVVRSFQKMFLNASFRKKTPANSDDDEDSDQGSGLDETDSDEESDCEEIAGDENKEEENDELALRPRR